MLLYSFFYSLLCFIIYYFIRVILTFDSWVHYFVNFLRAHIKFFCRKKKQSWHCKLVYTHDSKVHSSDLSQLIVRLLGVLVIVVVIVFVAVFFLFFFVKTYIIGNHCNQYFKYVNISMDTLNYIFVCYFVS